MYQRNTARVWMLSMFLLCSGGAFAQLDAEKPLHANLSVGGNFAVGNLNQLQAFANGRFSYSGNDLGVDVMANAFRFWMMPNGQSTWRQVGDDLNAMVFPYYYFRPHYFVHGFARYETSQLHQLDARFLVGGGVGFAPLRSPDPNAFLRFSLGTYAEQSLFPGTDLTRNVPHDKGTRSAARLGILSNGHVTLLDAILRVRYLLFCFVDPFAARDLRLGLDTSIDFKIWGPINFRINSNLFYNSVVLTTVQPYDVRTTFGVGWDFRA